MVKSRAAEGAPKSRTADSRALALAVAAEMRAHSRRTWTLVQFSDADWTHGYCRGDRLRAWSASGKSLRSIKPPRLLAVPCAQFCVRGDRVLVERSVAEKSGVGLVYEIRKRGGLPVLDAAPDGARWKT